MKVYTKKNNGLRLLGEGMVFSKGQLMLKEQDGNTNDASLGADVGSSNGKPLQFDATNGKNATSASQIEKNIANISSKTSSIPNKQARLDIGDVKWRTTSNINDNEPGADVDITAQGNTQQDINNAVDQAVKVRAGGVVMPLNQSVTPRKVMDEMRANSVPFTKTELTKFLKSI
jgi:hypothetical protein